MSAARASTWLTAAAVAALCVVATGSGEAGRRAAAAPGLALRTVLHPPVAARTASGSPQTGTFTGRLEPDGRWFHRLTFRLVVPRALGRVTRATLRLGRSDITGEHIVLRLCGMGSTAGCAHGSREVAWLSNEHVQWLDVLGASVDVRTTGRPDGALRGWIAPRRALTWTTADVAEVERERWTTARVEGADRHWPVAARIRLVAPRGGVGIQAAAACRQRGSGVYTRTGALDSPRSWRLVSTGRPIVLPLPARERTEPCRWVVDALGTGGRMTLRLETLSVR